MAEIRTRFSPRDRAENALSFEGERSRTKKSMAAETDINAIVKRHRQTGVVQHVNGRVPAYGDFSRATTLQEAFTLVHDAEEAFMTLPAEVRKIAENDPVALLDLLADPAGERMLIEAGLDPDFEREPQVEPIQETAETVPPSEPEGE